jgi:hypothetical protein
MQTERRELAEAFDILNLDISNRCGLGTPSLPKRSIRKSLDN